MTDSLRDQLQASLRSAYTLERELGGGGMSRVFLAEETRFHRRVVIKVLSPELAAGLSAERFEREIGLAAGLQQANVVPVITAGDVDGMPWYTMPYVDGESLRVRLARGPVPLMEAVAILRDVARALAYAHERGIVHRDIKPENILLSGGAAVVTDFGIAKALSAAKTRAPGGTLTAAGMSLGTPAYMAPEQAVGDEVDHRSDLYSWGIVAYELLAGHHPFAGKTTAQQLIAAHISETPPPLDTQRDAVPTPLARIIMRALEKDPKQRPASATELIAALDTVSSGAQDAHDVGRTWNPRVAGAALVAVLVLLAAVFLLARRRTATDPESVASIAASTGRSVAVMPLANVGGDTADAYFADGLTEELTSAVAKLNGIRVVGGTSASMWKGKPNVDLNEVGTKLRVEKVLEGSVRRAGARLRIVARLSNTADGTLVWTDSYERGVGDVFAVQADIARAVAAALRVPLGVDDAHRLARAGTRDTVAHELFLRARHLHYQYSVANLRDAIGLYARAAERDSAYAEPWAGQGLAWFNLADETIPPREAVPHMIDAARRALAIDSTLGDARIVLAAALASSRPATVTAAEARRAAELAPNTPLVQLFAGMLVAPLDPAGAAVLSGRGRDLDPLSPIIVSTHGFILAMAGRLAEAERFGREGTALAPELGVVHAQLGITLLREGKTAEALATFQRGIAGGDRDLSYTGAGIALARLGRMDEARSYRRKLEADARTRYVIGDWVAKLCLELGDRDAALTWLERAANERSNYLRLINIDPAFEVLRGNPRFEAVRRKAGLEARN